MRRRRQRAQRAALDHEVSSVPRLPPACGFGIGRPPGRMDPAAYVLRDFSSAERKDVDVLVERAADAIESLLVDGVSATQNRFHSDPAD